jgi:Cu/Ag efflux pump CusA
MIGHIIAWSLRNKLFVVLAGVLLLGWGGWQLPGHRWTFFRT